MIKTATNLPQQLRVSIGHASTAGRKRTNQDFVGAIVPEGSVLAMKGVTLAVADGISSSPVSGEASHSAVASLLTDYYCTSDAWSVQTAGEAVIGAINSWLHSSNRRDHLEDRNSGRICTLSVLVLKGREAHILHVGDTRIARFSGRSLEPLTRDHRAPLPDGGTCLARALGAEPSVDIDYTRLTLTRGDVFVLTSDGVHEHVDASIVASAMAETANLDEAAEQIVAAAMKRGSTDNLTCQLVRVEALPPNDEHAFDSSMASLPLRPPPTAGSTIDGYRIVRGLHSTARSHVLLAVTADGEQVALKIPTREMAENPAYLSRFVLEEWIARRLASPHVLPAATPPEKRTALYCVTRFIDGLTLRQWMTDNPAPSVETVRGIVEQIARGLRAFHRKDMLHQDLRPENILIDNDGTVCIIDFGSVAVAGLEEAAPGLAGAMPGTFQYTAPEYLSGDPVDWRSDLYSLGVITYEMLTGRLPYGAKAGRVRSRRDRERLMYRSARSDDIAVPDWMDASLKKTVHPDPLRRHDALSEFLAALRAPPSNWHGQRHVPLIERNPVRFWQGVALLLALGLIAALATR